jgi:hypothetical protein
MSRAGKQAVNLVLDIESCLLANNDYGLLATRVHAAGYGTSAAGSEFLHPSFEPRSTDMLLAFPPHTIVGARRPIERKPRRVCGNAADLRRLEERRSQI